MLVMAQLSISHDATNSQRSSQRAVDTDRTLKATRVQNPERFDGMLGLKLSL